jgi:hypothetical protein
VGRLTRETLKVWGMDNYEKFYRDQFRFSFLMAVIVGIIVFFLWLFGVIEF